MSVNQLLTALSLIMHIIAIGVLPQKPWALEAVLQLGTGGEIQKREENR
jgi:hypothetical protein